MNISEKLLENFDLMEFLLESVERGFLVSLYVREDSVGVTIQDPEIFEESPNKDIAIEIREELDKKVLNN